MKTDTVVVCGTGIAGLAAALGMARAGIPAALVGPRRVPSPARSGADNDQYGARVYAISPASREFLDGLGVWNRLDSARIGVVQSMEIYGDADGRVTLQAWQATQPALAWIVESDEIERVLQDAVHVFGVQWHAEKVAGLEPGAVLTDTGRRLDAGLVIGADGAGSPVRKAAGIRHDSTPYGDVGVVTHLTAERAHAGSALQWFTGDSVLALLPMPDTGGGHQVSMVWSMPRARADSLLALPEPERAQQLERQLQQATGERLGRLQVRSAVAGFPLFLDNSGMIAPGVALVGDAAHRVHPLAGQGLNLGLADVRALIQVLADKEPYRATGDLRVLRRYRRMRAESLLSMRLATDGLYRLFATHGAPAAWTRNIGMRMVDCAPFIKQRLIAAASGE